MQTFDPDDRRYRCCCGNFNVERGAYIIGVVGVVFGVLGLVSTIVQGQVTNSVSVFLSLLLYVSIIYAQRKQNPSLYWPFLIFNGLGLVMIATYIVALVVFFIVMPEAWIDFIKPSGTDKQNKETVILSIRIYTALIILFTAIFAAMSIWFQMVVYRAYEYMKMNLSSLSAQPKA